MNFEWNVDKDQKLREKRGVGFEDIVKAIAEGKILDVLKHHNQEKYPGQYLIIIEIDGYAYVVPCHIEGETIFFMTIYPSRKMTKKYLRERQNGKDKA
jgi:uncharacterized DUF497 family protein